MVGSLQNAEGWQAITDRRDSFGFGIKRSLLVATNRVDLYRCAPLLLYLERRTEWTR